MNIREKIKIKSIMRKESITEEKHARSYMDRITDKLDNNALRRAYNGAYEKYKSKPNKNTEYMVNYFKQKLEERHIGIPREKEV